MDLMLIRTDYRSDGIFGELRLANMIIIAYTLTHSYINADGTYSPKIPPGTYTCVRGRHRLENQVNDFETFEITGVPNHTGLLFHVGNWACDSTGCELLGHSVSHTMGVWMITASAETFAYFMKLQADVDTFTLRVIG